MSEAMVGGSVWRWTCGRSRLRFYSSRQMLSQMLSQTASHEREEQPGEQVAALATSARALRKSVVRVCELHTSTQQSETASRRLYPDGGQVCCQIYGKSLKV